MKASSSEGHGVNDAVTGLWPHPLLESFPRNKTPGRGICLLQHYTLDVKYKQGKFSSKNIKLIHHFINFITKIQKTTHHLSTQGMPVTSTVSVGGQLVRTVHRCACDVCIATYTVAYHKAKHLLKEEKEI